LHEVTRDARDTFDALLRVVERLPDEYFTNPRC
jgi:hypothetical protein